MEWDFGSMSSLNETFIWSIIIDHVSGEANFSPCEAAGKEERGICDERRFIVCSVPDCEARYCFAVGRLQFGRTVGPSGLDFCTVSNFG
jgi:hypothetical protein